MLMDGFNRLFQKELCMKDLNLYGQISLILIIIGGISWGLVGLFNMYLVTAIVDNLLGRLVYIVVGVAAGYTWYLIYLEKTKKA